MKRAAMVRIHQSEILLELWLSYYSRYFEDLFVFAGSYGRKGPGTFEDLKLKYNFNYIELTDHFYSQGSHERVFEKQKELLVDHEWVLYSDADEFVVADPDVYDGLRHFMDVCKVDQTYCEGFEVFQSEGELPLDYTRPILSQRGFWYKDTTKSYSKPALSRIPTDWDVGFHHIRNRDPQPVNVKETGLYLLHMKYADPDRVFDFMRDTTGNHGFNLGEAKPIPEKVRRTF